MQTDQVPSETFNNSISFNLVAVTHIDDTLIWLCDNTDEDSKSWEMLLLYSHHLNVFETYCLPCRWVGRTVQEPTGLDPWGRSAWSALWTRKLETISQNSSTCWRNHLFSRSGFIYFLIYIQYIVLEIDCDREQIHFVDSLCICSWQRLWPAAASYCTPGWKSTWLYWYSSCC